MNVTKCYLYCQFDRYVGNTMFYQVASSDSQAILALLQVTHIPLTTSTLLCLGELVSELPVGDPSNPIELTANEVLHYNFYDIPRVVPWTNCQLPETPAEALAPLGLPADQVKQLVLDMQHKMIADSRR